LFFGEILGSPPGTRAPEDRLRDQYGLVLAWGGVKDITYRGVERQRAPNRRINGTV
jgi:hypothetical protein